MASHMTTKGMLWIFDIIKVMSHGLSLNKNGRVMAFLIKKVTGSQLFTEQNEMTMGSHRAKKGS